jgi:hypothetical protein
MLHAYVERFDVMGRKGNILGWEGEVNKTQVQKTFVLPCPKKEYIGMFVLPLLFSCLYLNS